MQSLATLGNEQKMLSGEHKAEQNTLSDVAKKKAITLRSSLTSSAVLLQYNAAND